ncbi:MAG TPA: hypothetical protein PLP07_04480 [Pyrinomonadaceae bacterium]|nr:hypothetical protein [Chloracidobacterium sp.]MBP9935883.1 hypothetical protein [Pyrinomonadaceae bacterium]MBK7802416.1 hypothetical protein [Chloracidobacterium sp.]MBK9437285.1 hypothetical protein [Chloracidobacterium sp.]MBK9766023.1 hypothetical protein [Chloracidobacterium sp.]
MRIYLQENTAAGRRKRFLVIGLALVAVISLIGSLGSYIYWQRLKDTPQYSLALLIDAAKRDDQNEIDELINIDNVVDDFLPQITVKAVEIYGRGLPPAIVGQLTKVAAPMMPAVKDRARAVLPGLIRERVERFGNVPFAAMVLGAGQYLDIKVSGDNAIVKSKLPEHPLELKMRRNGARWQIVGVRDEQLATDIAKKIGQEIISIAMGGINKTANQLGIGNLADLLRQAEELIK